MSRVVAVAKPLWAALRARTEPVSVAELAATLNLNPASVRKNVWRLEKAGLVARTGFSRSKTHRETLQVIMTEKAEHHTAPPALTEAGAVPPLKETPARQRIWSAIRVLKRFNRIEAEQCSEQSRSSVEHYLNCLLRAGYVRRVRPHNPLTGALAEYQLVQNTGFKAPLLRQGRRDGRFFRELTDLNTGACHEVRPLRPRGRRARKAAPRSETRG